MRSWVRIPSRNQSSRSCIEAPWFSRVASSSGKRPHCRAGPELVTGHQFAEIAQTVEQHVEAVRVGGSMPSLGARLVSANLSPSFTGEPFPF